MKRFCVDIKLTNNKSAKVYELKNKKFFNLLKFLQNQDYTNAEKYLEKIINKIIVEKEIIQHLNLIDKFIILLMLRSVFISPDLKLQSKDKTVSSFINISLPKIITQLTVNFDNNVLKENDIEIFFSLPKQLFFNDLSELAQSCIDKIKINEDEKDLSNLSTEDKRIIFENLPGSIFFKILDKIKQLDKELEKIILLPESKLHKIDKMYVSLVNNTLFTFTVACFSESLKNFYDLIYFFTTKLKFSLNDFFNLTPAETSLFTNLFIAEQEELKKASEKDQSKGPLLGKK